MGKLPGRSTGLLVTLLLAAGLWLRVYFVRWHPFVAGDSGLYLDIAQSWIDSHTYGLSTNTVPRPTLIRLPGYPMVLAAIQLIDPASARTPDGSGVFAIVHWLQVAADLITCALLSNLAWRNFGRRAGLVALALTTLCPFLANYTAVPLTECFVVFLTALAWWAADRWRHTLRQPLLVTTGAALAYGILLRPDQGLLAAATIPLFVLRQNGRLRWQFALAVAALTALPLVPWTVRNAVTFHVFQPLSPRTATDPGETYAKGFPRWYRTFAIDFTSTEDAYWNYPENPVDPNDLPARAFDSPEERAATVNLLQRAAQQKKLSPSIDAAFDRLATDRVHAHPFRSRVVLPVGRLLNMLLHPRIEMLPLDERWWRFRLHPAETLFSSAYALLNLCYLLAAAWGVRRAWRVTPALTASMLGFFVLRCALLLTLDNAEQRYTLEFLPGYMVLAAAAVAPGLQTKQARA